MTKKIISLLLGIALLVSLYIVTGCNGNNGNNPSDNTPPHTEQKEEYVQVTVVGGTGGGYYKKGDTGRFTANTPAEGKEFAYWLLGDVADDERISADSEIVLIINDAMTLTAVYVDSLPSLDDIEFVTLTVRNSKGVSVYTYEKGSTVMLRAGEGGYFDKWLVNGKNYGNDRNLIFTIEDDTIVEEKLYSENVLFKKTILGQSSSHKTLAVGNLLDGNLETHWATNAKATNNGAVNHYVTIDLGAVYEIKAFFISERGDLEPDNPLHPYYYRITSFEVEYSLDNSEWFTAAEYDEAITEEREIVLNESITAQYIRLQYHCASNENTHLSEFQAFAPVNSGKEEIADNE